MHGGRRTWASLLPVALVAVAACGRATPVDDDSYLIVTTSAVVHDVVTRIAGDLDGIEVVSVVPNGFDAHTYEPRPSEIAQLSRADTIVLADATLHQGITQLAQLSGDRDRIVDLNAALAATDKIYREGSNSWNPHTWTDPTLVIAWIDPLVAALTAQRPSATDQISANAEAYRAELVDLDAEIEDAIVDIAPARRKLVVYHDAWEYFGHRYGLDVVGALQATDFAEPSAAELAAMVDQIRTEGVPAFFGSEVFPSDVLVALESASGARYIPDLADDRLIGSPGDPSYGYVPLMRANLALLLEGLQ